MLQKEEILKQLRTVEDPELHINIVDLGLIYDVAVVLSKSVDKTLTDVEITMTLTTPGCPLSYTFQEIIPAAVKKLDGVKDVRIDLVWEPAWDPDKMSDDAKETLGIIR